MPVVRISEELFKEIQKYAEPLVDNFEAALWKVVKASKGEPVGSKVPKQRRFRGELTPQRTFRKPILEILISKGGTAEGREVVEELERVMEPTLKPADYEENSDGTTKWTKAANFQRLTMVHDGLLADNSERGIWQATDKGRLWLKERRGRM
jgi:hypothetical protein